MNTKQLYFLVVVLVALGAGVAVQQYYTPRVMGELPVKVLTLDGGTINARVAESGPEQEKGLMGVTSLTDGEGMLFPFAPARVVSFWNQGMLMPFDLIWIRSGRVLGIESNFPKLEIKPITKESPGSIDNVIELSAGWVSRHGTRVGDQIFGL